MSDLKFPSAASFARHAATGVALLLLAACATPADPERMVATETAGAGAGFPAALQHVVCVRNITGGEATNPLWVSEVDNAGFSAALTNSLRGVGLLGSPGACRYNVDVDLLGLSQPTAGFSMEVTSHANYKVYDSGGKAVLLATISAPYTAEFTESLIGVERLRRANEGAIRASITQFLDQLRKIKR